ncbi:MAG: universal stress protein [Planctomycetes bacterium]|nr:universal stress protein [Planctomycetota bacterium]
MMLERILVPLDGSPLAESILSQLRRLLRAKDADVLLLRCVLPTPLIETGATALSWPALQEQAEQYVRSRAKDLEAQGIRARGIIGLGSPAETILDVAAQERATLIAMTTHGRTGLARWIRGSVTEKVLRASPVPVLLVRSFRPESGKPAPGAELPFRRIVLPIDGSALSEEAVPCVVELATLFSSHVSVLHVLEDPVGVPVPEITRMVAQLRAKDINAEPLLGKGDPASEILDECRRQSADLIAITTHGRSGIARWVLGSVAEKVLRAATVPLLVVRTRTASTTAVSV